MFNVFPLRTMPPLARRTAFARVAPVSAWLPLSRTFRVADDTLKSVPKLWVPAIPDKPAILAVVAV